MTNKPFDRGQRPFDRYGWQKQAWAYLPQPNNPPKEKTNGN